MNKREVNVTILLDNLLAEEFKTLDPYYNVPSVNKSYGISGNLSMLAPPNSIMSNYLYDKRPDVIQDTVVGRMKFIEV